jgi:hypothetical protein
MGRMEIIALLSPFVLSFVVIAALGFMTMIFSIVFAQLLYGLFDS